MNEKFPSPAKLVTQPALHWVAPEKIIVENGFPRSEALLELILAFYKGKLDGVLTRLPTRALNVCVELSGKTPEIIALPVNENSVTAVAQAIRSGARPTILVYQSKYDSRYISSDDANTVAAYLKSGIDVVPCLVLGVPKELEEGGLVVRGLESTANIYVATKAAKATDRLPSLGQGDDAIHALVKLAQQTKENIRTIDPGFDRLQTHWVYILYSVCERLERLLFSTNVLMKKSLNEESAILVRSLYELALTFHLNWISPEFCGGYLQLVGRGRGVVTAALRELKAARPNGVSREQHKAQISSHQKMYKLCISPKLKAELAPLGVLHERVYEWLSGATHQEFDVYAAFSGKLVGEADVAVAYDKDALLAVANASATSILQRVRNDVGLSDSIPA